MLRHAPQQETQVQISIHHSVSFLSGAVHLIHSFLMNQHHSEDHAPYTRIRGVARLSSEINGCNDVEACIEGHDRGVKVLHWAPLCTNKSTPCCHSCRVSPNVYSRLQVISVSRFNKATEQIPKTVQSGDLGALKVVDTKYAGGTVPPSCIQPWADNINNPCFVVIFAVHTGSVHSYLVCSA